MFLGSGLADLDGGKGIEPGSQVSEEHLWNMLVACSDPVSGETIGSLPRRSGSAPVAGFDLCFSPPKSFSVLWALADDETRDLLVFGDTPPTPSPRQNWWIWTRARRTGRRS